MFPEHAKEFLQLYHLILQSEHIYKRLNSILVIFAGTCRGVYGVIPGNSSAPTASSNWWRSCLTFFRFSDSFVLVHGCPTYGIFWFGHDFFFW